MHLKPCIHRGPDTCHVINRKLGWRHGLSPSVCIACDSNPNSPALHAKVADIRRFVSLTLNQAPISVVKASSIRNPLSAAWWASKRWVFPYLLSKLSTFFLGLAPDIVVAYRLSFCLTCPGRRVGPDHHSYCTPCQCSITPANRLDGRGFTKLRHWYLRCPLSRFHPFRAIVRNTAHTSEYI